MANNVTIPPSGTGTATPVVATDDVGGVHYQKIKLDLGGDGVSVPVSAGAGAVGTGTARTTLGSDDPAVVSLQILDDWDEVDRAKVNLIVGQAGIAGGTGVDGATVPRVTLATTVGLPAGSALLGKVGTDQTTPGTTDHVSPIAGQNGIAGGAGATGATTPRVVLATDTTVPNVTGNVAHDGVDSGNPVKVGAVARTAPPTAVAAGDRVDLLADIYGRLTMRLCLREQQVWQTTTITSSTAETTILTADVTYKLDVYAVIVSNTSATNTSVTLRDATAGGTARVFRISAGAMVGFVFTESSGLLQAAANNNWTLTSSVSVASLEVTVGAIKNL